MSSGSSPPPTPDIQLPVDSNHWRFQSVGPPCEWSEEYRPGGYHPVDLGDTFQGGAYTVIRKLGNGSYSTVWLAIDSLNRRYVALKIMIAKASTAINTELEITQFLSKKAHTDPRSQYITILLDTFIHQGPNGKHRCLVFEPMGPTSASMVDELPENKPKRFGKTSRYPKWMAKKILIHTLRGLSFLHENNVVHGDIQPGNLLFSIKDITTLDESELRQDEAIPDSVTPLRRLDGKIDKWAPKNLYLDQSLQEHVLLGSDLKVKISDLGAAFWANNPPDQPTTPIALRAPELILGKPFGPSIDIWAFGCLIFEFLTGRALFAVAQFGDKQEDRDGADDDHLLQLNDIIGKLPESVMDAWPRASKWYDPVNGRRLHPYAEENNPEPYIFDSLEVQFAENKPNDIDDEESALICSIIRQILAYSPEDRPSATDLLKISWFSE